MEYVDEMLQVLRDKKGYVHVDVPPPMTSSVSEVATEHARMRHEAIKRGERVAYLYTDEYNAKHAPLPPRYAKATGVTREQALQLLAAGAEWIGPDHWRPA